MRDVDWRIFVAISTVTRELSNKVLPKFLYREHGFCLFVYEDCYQIGGSTSHKTLP